MPIRVLHLFADSRWTGPADPVVTLVGALRSRGFDVRFACRRSPANRTDMLQHRAAARGVEPIIDFHLNRYGRPLQALSDVRSIRRYIDREGIDIVHTHLAHDHMIGGIASRRSRRRPLVVRTNHKGRSLSRGWLRDRVNRRYTDAIIGFSKLAMESDRQSCRLPADHTLVVNPALDLERFDPTNEYRDVRDDLGIEPGDVLAGIIARVQRHRRWDVLLEAMKRALERAPNLRLVILGRGTHFDELATQPVARMGLQRQVLLPGYRKDDYLDYLAALDFKVFLMPGSDGTCRAAREAMAMGKPVIAARRGMLPELVPDGIAGLVIDDTPDHLADAMARLAQDADLRKRLGEGARAFALSHFQLDAQVDAVAAFYRRLAGESSGIAGEAAP